jgi:hypothetical protein
VILPEKSVFQYSHHRNIPSFECENVSDKLRMPPRFVMEQWRKRVGLKSEILRQKIQRTLAFMYWCVSRLSAVGVTEMVRV